MDLAAPSLATSSDSKRMAALMGLLPPEYMSTTRPIIQLVERPQQTATSSRTTVMVYSSPLALPMPRTTSSEVTISEQNRLARRHRAIPSAESLLDPSVLLQAKTPSP